MDELIKQKIDNAKLILFRKDFKLQFFGLTLYNFKWEIKDFGHEKVLATILLSRDYADHNKKNKIIFLNERILKKEDYTANNLVFDLWHEILHFIHKHGIRRNNRDKEIYNLACDHVIDNIISKNSNIKPYLNKYNIINQYKDENITEEQIYQKLYNKYTNDQIQYTIKFNDEEDASDDELYIDFEMESDDNLNNNDLEEESNEDNSDEDNQQSESNKDISIDDKSNNNDLEEESNEDNSDDNSLEQEIEEYKKKLNKSLEDNKIENQLSNVKSTTFIIDNKQSIEINFIEKNPSNENNTRSIIEDIENIDDELDQEELYEETLNEIKNLYKLIEEREESVPYNIKSYLGKLLEVDLDWKMIYEKALKNQIKYKFNGVCWRRINPRYTHLNITLPVPNNQKKEPNKLNIFLDVSGSISRKQKRQFGHVSYTAFNYFEEITIYYHNTRIVDSKSFSKSDNKYSFLNYISESEIPDGGGTSHYYCYEKIKKDIEEQNNTSLSIFLTDGFSDIHEVHNQFKDDIKNHPMIYLISGNKYFNFDKKEYKDIEVIHIT